MRQVINSDELLTYRKTLDYFDAYSRALMKRGMAFENEERDKAEQRLDSAPTPYSGASDYHEPYEQDLSSFPDCKER